MATEGVPSVPSGAPRGDLLCAWAATDLAAAIREKEISPVDVTAAVLERIDALNPTLNAFCTVVADQATEAARDAEAAVVRGDELGPLHGVPYSLKDLTPTKGIRTTFGSKLFEHVVPTEDALVATRMRAAGGVLLGKTNTPDEGCKGVTDNLVFGTTYNPWKTDHTPGGSSGGAGAAVAAGMGPIAEGTDFAGSIRIPAAYCGLVGFKPSDGRIPTVPNNMLWHPITYCYGPIARTVADAALMLQVLAGADDRDPRSLADPHEDFREVVKGDVSVAGLRIGYLPDLGFMPIEPVVAETCARAAAVFAGLGCHVDEDRTDFSDSIDAYGLLNSNRRGALMEPYLPERADDVDPLLVWRTEFAATKTSIDAAKASMVQAEMYQRVRGLLERFDLLLVPTTPNTAYPVGVDFPSEIAGVPMPSPFNFLPLTSLFNMTGHPAMSVPAGWTDDGLPVGIQIVGPWRDDVAVLQAAAAFERAAPWAGRWPEVVG